jgi:hypothetical protein
MNKRESLMIIQIPEEIKKEIQCDTPEDLNKIIDTARATSNNTILPWAIYSKAEFLVNYLGSRGEAFQLYEKLSSIPNLPDDILKQAGMIGMAYCYFQGWANRPADLGAAYQLCETLLNMPNLPDRTKQWAAFAKAECLRNGWPNHPADVGAAYQLYEMLLNMPNLSDEIKPFATSKKAGCLLNGWPNHPADVGAAYQLYEMLLNMPNLSDEIKRLATISKAECLRHGWPNHPADFGATYQLLETFLTMPNSSDKTKQWAAFAKAECLRNGWPNHPADFGAAYQLLELDMSNLPDRTKQRAAFAKAECLRNGWPNHPADFGAANQLYRTLLNMPNLLDEIKKKITVMVVSMAPIPISVIGVPRHQVSPSNQIQKIPHQMTVGMLTPATTQGVTQANVIPHQASSSNQSTDQDLRQAYLDLKNENNHLKKEIALLKQQKPLASSTQENFIQMTTTTPPSIRNTSQVNNNTFFQEPRPATPTANRLTKRTRNSPLSTPPPIQTFPYTVVYKSPLTPQPIQTFVSKYSNAPYKSLMLSTQTNIFAHAVPEAPTFNEQTVLDPHLVNNPNSFFQEYIPGTQTSQNNENPISATNAGEVVEYSGENYDGKNLQALSHVAVKPEPTHEENGPSAKRRKK